MLLIFKKKNLPCGVLGGKTNVLHYLGLTFTVIAVKFWDTKNIFKLCSVFSFAMYITSLS